MASGDENIMGLFKKWFGGNLFSKGQKKKKKLYTKVRSRGVSNMKKLYTKMVMTLGVGKHSL